MSNKGSDFYKMLTKDFWWKLLSLAIAVTLWFVVINIQNPEDSRNYSINLEVRNMELLEENNQVITNLNEVLNGKITFKIRGQRLSLDKLNKSWIVAYVDIADIIGIPENGETVSLPVKYSFTQNGENYRVEAISPQTVHLVIENLKSVEMEIIPYYLSQPPANYEAALPIVNPQTVVVSGTENLVNSVVGVRVGINVDSLTEDSTQILAIEPYNENDVEVLGVVLSEDTAEVYIPIRATKQIPLVIEAIGMPKDGYVLEEISLTPDYVFIVGDEETLAEINEIRLPDLNISGRDSDMEMGFVLRYLLPDGINLRATEPERAVVTAVIVEESTKDVVLKEENVEVDIDLEEGLNVELSLIDIPLQLKGLNSILEDVSDSDIAGALSIIGLDPGEYRLPIIVTIPEGVRLTEGESPYVRVVITQESENE